MANWIVLVVFGVMLPLLALFYGLPHALRGLKTGELEARGRNYFRERQPGRFWAGIVFWFTLAALSLFTAIVVISQFPGRP
jgi:hypothetical protein